MLSKNVRITHLFSRVTLKGALSCFVLIVLFSVFVPYAPLSRSAEASNPSWWDNAYGGRFGLTLMTNDALPSDYTVEVTINHQKLVAEGRSRADGEDVRIVRWNGSSWGTERDRVLAPGSSWNSASTRLHFRVEAAIAANTTNREYYLYFEQPSASGAPKNGENVYFFYDDFEGSVLDTTNRWDVLQEGSSTYSLENGRLFLRGASAYSPNRLLVTSKEVQAPGFHTYTAVQVLASHTHGGLDAGLDERLLSYSLDGTPEWWNWEYSIGLLAPSHFPAGPWSAPAAIEYRMIQDGGTITATVFENHDRTYTHTGFSPTPYPFSLAFYSDHGSFYAEAAFDYFAARRAVVREPVVAVEASSEIRLSAVMNAELSLTVQALDPADGCNGVGLNRPTTSSLVDLGELLPGANQSGGQQLSLATNAAEGAVVRIQERSPLRGSGHDFTKVASSNAAPAPFPSSGEAFGYTSSGAFPSNTWAALRAEPDPIFSRGAPVDESFCVAYRARGSGLTPAGDYSAQVRYSAVGLF